MEGCEYVDCVKRYLGHLQWIEHLKNAYNSCSTLWTKHESHSRMDCAAECCMHVIAVLPSGCVIMFAKSNQGTENMRGLEHRMT